MDDAAQSATRGQLGGSDAPNSAALLHLGQNVMDRSNRIGDINLKLGDAAADGIDGRRKAP
jgi:hypothetical protein